MFVFLIVTASYELLMRWPFISRSFVCQRMNDREWAEGEMNSRTIFQIGEQLQTVAYDASLWRKKNPRTEKKKRKILRIHFFASSRLIRRQWLYAAKTNQFFVLRPLCSFHNARHMKWSVAGRYYVPMFHRRCRRATFGVRVGSLVDGGVVVAALHKHIERAWKW